MLGPIRLPRLLLGTRHSHAHYYSAPPTSSSHLRKTFLDFFKSEHHLLVPSSSLLPAGDKTLHFTNAGMNQFKPVFLGLKSPPAPRLANAQKCVRTSDLCAVGRDGTHHSFFEMLGSWSFGDYGKERACEMAWRMLTKEIGLNKENLSVTYFGGCKELGLGPDEETKQIWLDLGVPANRVLPFNAKDNFWAMGRTGPCGPCTEIHYDRNGFSPARVNQDGSSSLELWNLVFMEFNRQDNGCLTKLPFCHVDTGMGLERLTAIANGSETNYNTDLFLPLFKTIETVSGCPAYQDIYRSDDKLNMSYRVLADHMRMVTACVTDGIYPVSSHRLKQVLRRSLCISKEVFGADSELLAELALTTHEVLGDHYTDITKNLERLDTVLDFESELYLQQQESGRKMYPKLCSGHPGFEGVDVIEAPLYFEALNVLSKQDGFNGKVLTGENAFLLYESVGLHSEQLEILSSRAKLAYNPLDYEKVFRRKKSESLSGHKMDTSVKISSIPDTDDSFKYKFQSPAPNQYNLPLIRGTVLMIFDEQGHQVEKLTARQKGRIHMDKTTFYADAGGQAADTGKLTSVKDAESVVSFTVEDCRRIEGNSKKIAHIGCVEEGSISMGDQVLARINVPNRLSSMQNHTGLHMFHGVVNDKLPLTSQQGSRVTAKGFRLDLTTFGAKIDVEFIADVEETLNGHIEGAFPIVNEQVSKTEMEVLDVNLVTLPGFLYPDTVTLIQCPGGQVEPCGGTHLVNSSDVQSLTVLEVKSLSPGATSFYCLTGESAAEARDNGIAVLDQVQKVNAQIQTLTDSSPQSEVADMLKLVRAIHAVVTKHDLLPYTVRKEMSSILSELEAHLKSKVVKSSKEAMVASMQKLVQTSGGEKVALKNLTNLTPHKPVLVICETDSHLMAKAVVPELERTASFTAKLWLEAAFGPGEVKAPRGQDETLIVNYKVKKVPGEKMSDLVAMALQKADQFATENVK